MCGELFLFLVRFKTGDGDLQGVVIDRNFIPSQRMHFLVGLVLAT